METASHRMETLMKIGHRDTENTEFLLWVMQRPNRRAIAPAPQPVYSAETRDAILEQCVFHKALARPR